MVVFGAEIGVEKSVASNAGAIVDMRAGLFALAWCGLAFVADSRVLVGRAGAARWKGVADVLVGRMVVVPRIEHARGRELS